MYTHRHIHDKPNLLFTEYRKNNRVGKIFVCLFHLYFLHDSENSCWEYTMLLPLKCHYNCCFCLHWYFKKGKNFLEALFKEWHIDEMHWWILLVITYSRIFVTEILMKRNHYVFWNWYENALFLMKKIFKIVNVLIFKHLTLSWEWTMMLSFNGVHDRWLCLLWHLRFVFDKSPSFKEIVCKEKQKWVWWSESRSEQIL